MTAAPAITKHKIINLPLAWIETATAEDLGEALELRERLIPAFDAQQSHPVVDRVTGEDVKMAMAAFGVLEGLRYLLKTIEDGATAIENMASDPLNHAFEPDIWRRIDLAIANKRLDHPGEVLQILVTGGMRPGKSFSCARRAVAHFCYTEKAAVFGVSETVETSAKLQQQPIERFLPESISPKSGKKQQSKHEKFKFSGGHFTGEAFSATDWVEDENGRKLKGGGDFVFRFFSQLIATFQGYELTGVWADELIPLPHVKTLIERMATRAADTNKPEFLERIKKAKALLEAGKPLPTALLGAIYHGVLLLSFTPYEGWSETVNHFLRGAVKYDFEISPDLQGRAGVKDARVPRFAQPPDPTKLVAYVFTSDNMMKPAYPALRAQLKNAPESEVRIKLHGDVSQDWTTLFSGFDETKHVKSWKDAPRDGAIYEVSDPAGAKPWAIGWYLVDVAGRIWVLQEWPCPTIPIEGSLPGLWAVPSEGRNINGDKGPAQKLRLNWTRKSYTRLIWEMRRRIVEKFAATGEPFKGRVTSSTLTWEGLDGWTLEGKFVEPELSLMDSRFAGARTDTDADKGSETITFLESMLEQENAIEFEPASGINMSEGDMLIQSTLADEILGLPGLIVLDECENHRFTLRTYSYPEFKEGTSARDEACKECRDLLAYCLLSDPQYVDKAKGGWRDPYA